MQGRYEQWAFANCLLSDGHSKILTSDGWCTAQGRRLYCLGGDGAACIHVHESLLCMRVKFNGEFKFVSIWEAFGRVLWLEGVSKVRVQEFGSVRAVLNRRLVNCRDAGELGRFAVALSTQR